MESISSSRIHVEGNTRTQLPWGDGLGAAQPNIGISDPIRYTLSALKENKEEVVSYEFCPANLNSQDEPEASEVLTAAVALISNV